MRLYIEGSPDRWWVTSYQWLCAEIKGNWRVTRSLVSYVCSYYFGSTCSCYWRVTRSLVSYVKSEISTQSPIKLKGHQIVGELRQYRYRANLKNGIEGSPDRWWVTSLLIPLICFVINWRVTRSLVSYVFFNNILLCLIYIEGSPDHWWVTSCLFPFFKVLVLLKGHQIVGELRQYSHNPPLSSWNWRVTRSLVSYVFFNNILLCLIYIEGSPDRWWVTSWITNCCHYLSRLKGHQIVGELRL